VIAARAALRVLPLAVQEAKDSASADRGERLAELTGAIFRATAIAYTSAKLSASRRGT
jgi:hypothetical protein